MSSTQVLIIVLIVLAVLVVAGLAWYFSRRRQLQQRFGPEYDRAVEERESRLAAERELREREARRAELELRELSPEARERFTARWQEIQAQFVDDPENSLGSADELITELMAERGYPTGDYDERVSHLSVDHARTLGNYREAHEISERNRRGEATTEQLRRAVLSYRNLFGDLLGEPSPRRGDERAVDVDESPRRVEERVVEVDESSRRADEDDLDAEGRPRRTVDADDVYPSRRDTTDG